MIEYRPPHKTRPLTLYCIFSGISRRKNLSDLADTVRARQKRRLPVVLTREEIHHLFSFLESPYLLMAQLIYGSGLRLMECIRLRVKDIDFANNLLIIRAGKGEKVSA